MINRDRARLLARNGPRVAAATSSTRWMRPSLALCVSGGALRGKKDRWNDVAIEVYYEARSRYNLDRMIAAVKASLDYYTTNFAVPAQAVPYSRIPAL